MVSPFKVNNVSFSPPDDYSWGLQDISASEAGRTQDANATMQKMLITQKRKVNIAWKNRTAEEVAALLQAFNHEYVNVTYHDAMTNAWETRTFYTGDKSSAYKQITQGTYVVSSLSFNLIER